MIAGSQKKPPLGLSEASDRAEHAELRTTLGQRCTAEAACEQCRTHPAAYTIADFCRLHGGMSRATFYNLRKRGDAPVIMKVGRRTYISTEAAVNFRRRMEVLADANPARG